jgi:hypothetical protein
MSSFATDKISIYGFTQLTTGRKTYDDTPLATDLPACVQPGGTDVLVLSMASINATKAYIIYLEDVAVQIKNGYKIVDQRGGEYIVHGEPEVWDNGGITLRHQKIVVEKAI